MQSDLWKTLSKDEKKQILEKVKSMRKAREESATAPTKTDLSVASLSSCPATRLPPLAFSVPASTTTDAGILETLQLGVNAPLVMSAVSAHIEQEKTKSSSALRKPRKTRKGKSKLTQSEEELSPFGFADIIQSMMHAFGDAAEPERSSATIIEKAAVEFGREVLATIRAHLGRDALRLADFSRLLPVTTLMFFRWKAMRSLARTDIRKSGDSEDNCEDEVEGGTQVGLIGHDLAPHGNAMDSAGFKSSVDVELVDVDEAIEGNNGSQAKSVSQNYESIVPATHFSFPESEEPSESHEQESAHLSSKSNEPIGELQLRSRESESTSSSYNEESDLDDETLSELYMARSRRALLQAQSLSLPRSLTSSRLQADMSDIDGASVKADKAKMDSGGDGLLQSSISGEDPLQHSASFGTLDADRQKYLSSFLEREHVIPPEFYERLEFANSRSSAMTELQYSHFVACREVGFLRGRRLANMFASLFPPPALTPPCLEVLSFIVYDYIGRVVEGANRLIGSGSLTPNFYTPLPQVAIITSISCQPTVPTELEEVVSLARRKRERLETGAILRMARTRKK